LIQKFSLTKHPRIQASSFFSTSAGSCGGGARSPARVAVLLVRPAPCEIFSRPRFLAATESSSVQMVSESCERDASPIPPGDRVRSAIKSGRGALRCPGFARNASLLLTNLDSFLPEPTRGARRSYRLSLIRLAHPEKILARRMPEATGTGSEPGRKGRTSNHGRKTHTAVTRGRLRRRRYRCRRGCSAYLELACRLI